MSELWIEFLKIAVGHLLAAASPGPDFALVVRQSLAFGRRTAIWTSIGIGTAILLHTGYSLLGLGLLIRSSALWFSVVKYAGAGYLAWLGLQALRTKPNQAGETSPATPPSRPTARAAFATGFLTNALNPKATLFLLSLFAVVVSPETPRLVRAGYGLWMVFATMAWFSLVSVVFTQERIRRKFLRHGHWIDRAMGVVFLAFAVSLAFAKVP